MKYILYWSLKGQTRFGMPRVAKMSLNWRTLLFIQIQILTVSMHHIGKKLLKLSAYNIWMNCVYYTFVDMVKVLMTFSTFAGSSFVFGRGSRQDKEATTGSYYGSV
jgi:hypothetical protein